jgi:hypothetical protein
MGGAGLAALLDPSQFATAVNFSYNEHFIHDAGAFQFGIAATLVLALWWRDSLVVALAGFLISNTIHAVNHAVDQALGGHRSDPWALAAVSVLIALALFIRVRQLRAAPASPIMDATRRVRKVGSE